MHQNVTEPVVGECCGFVEMFNLDANKSLCFLLKEIDT